MAHLHYAIKIFFIVNFQLKHREEMKSFYLILKKKCIKRRSNLTQNAINNITIGTHEHCHYLKSKQKKYKVLKNIFKYKRRRGSKIIKDPFI